MSSVYERLFHLSVAMLATADTNGFFRELNPAWEKTLGWTNDELKSMPFIEFVHPDDREATLAEASRLFEGHKTIRFENRYRCRDGSFRWLFWTSYVDMTEVPERRLIYATAHDITQAKDLELQLRAQHTQLRAAVQELSTPLIPIGDSVVIMPLIGHMDTERARLVMSAALAGAQEHRAKVVIIDVTGLQNVDGQVARSLVSASQALRLLGARTVLTGVQPQMAQALVGLGVDLTGLDTQGTLQSAIARALQSHSR
jgi:rsbT co-antagonist protein RsbR